MKLSLQIPIPAARSGCNLAMFQVFSTQYVNFLKKITSGLKHSHFKVCGSPTPILTRFVQRRLQNPLALTWWASGLWLPHWRGVCCRCSPLSLFPFSFVLSSFSVDRRALASSLVLLLTRWAQLQRASPGHAGPSSPAWAMGTTCLMLRLPPGWPTCAHSQLTSAFHSRSWKLLGLLQLARHLSLSPLQGCWLALRELGRAGYRPLHSQILPAKPGPGPGMRIRELDSYRVFSFFLLSKLSSFPSTLELFYLLAFSIGISISKISCLHSECVLWP